MEFKITEDINRPLPPNFATDIPVDYTNYYHGLTLAGLAGSAIAEKFLYPLSIVSGSAFGLIVGEVSIKAMSKFAGVTFSNDYLAWVGAAEMTIGAFGGYQMAKLKRHYDYGEASDKSKITLFGLNLFEQQRSARFRRDLDKYQPLIDFLYSREEDLESIGKAKAEMDRIKQEIHQLQQPTNA